MASVPRGRIRGANMNVNEIDKGGYLMAFKRTKIRRGKQLINLLFRKFIVNRHSWLAGGFVRWALSPNKKPVDAHDIDLFCRDQETFDKIKARLEEVYPNFLENPAAITFFKKGAKLKTLMRLQLIKPRDDGAVMTQGSIEGILENFDFTITRCAIVSPRRAIADEDFIRDEKAKKIVIKNIHCPISSTYRVVKYGKKGYTINLSEMVKLFLDWQERDNEYRERITELIVTENPTEEDINELERLLRID